MTGKETDSQEQNLFQEYMTKVIDLLRRISEEEGPAIQQAAGNSGRCPKRT